MFTVEAVSKYYGGHPALREVSFSLEEGDILGLLGLNGAGKSTLMKGVAGAVPFSSGDVRIHNASLSKQPLEYRSLLGYQPEIPCLPEGLTVREFAYFVATLHGLKGDDAKERIQTQLEHLSLIHLADALCGELSKGERQRVGFLAATVHAPQVLLLDEPMSGLDPEQMLNFRSFIRAKRESRITILSTHLLNEIHSVCNKLLILHQGEVTLFLDDLSTKSLEELEAHFLPNNTQREMGAQSV
jgi:ABC-2 type transport system ATP-binding protein